MLKLCIMDCLKTHYGIDVHTLTFLPLGADKDASLYKAEACNQLSYFVKIKRNYVMGLAVVELLHQAGIEQVIPPIKTMDHQLAYRMNDFTLVVYPFIEGQNGFTRALTGEQWQILGKTLRQIHEMHIPSSIQCQLRQEVYSSQWRESVRSLYTYIESGPMGDEIALKLAACMKKNIAAIRRLVDRSEQLAEIVQSESSNFVLCHSDIHAGNVLIKDTHALYIVDWDDPILAPKERDLMFIGGGIGNVWNHLYEEKFFYQGYGKTKINRTLLAYYRHERIVEDIAVYGQDLLLTTAGGEARSEMYQHFLAMFEPRGVVEIAFDTDEGLSK